MFLDQLSRDNNTISYSHDRSVTDTTISVASINATKLDLSLNEVMDFSDENIRIVNRAIDSFDRSSEDAHPYYDKPEDSSMRAANHCSFNQVKTSALLYEQNKLNLSLNSTIT